MSASHFSSYGEGREGAGGGEKKKKSQERVLFKVELEGRITAGGRGEGAQGR